MYTSLPFSSFENVMMLLSMSLAPFVAACIYGHLKGCFAVKWMTSLYFPLPSCIMETQLAFKHIKVGHKSVNLS